MLTAYRRRLLSVISLVILFAIGLSIAGGVSYQYIENRLKQNLIADYSKQGQTISREVALTLEDRIHNIQNMLMVIAQDKAVQSGSKAECDAAFKKYTKAIEIGVNNLGRVGLDGKFRCSINPALVGVQVSKLGDYLKPLFNKSDHPTVLSRKIIVPKVKGYVVALHVPVYNTKGKFVGSLGGAIYLDKLAQDYLKKVKFAHTGFVGMQDDNGDILYSATKGIIGKNYFSTEIQNQLGTPKAFQKAIRSGYAGHENIIRYSFRGEERIGAISPVDIIPGHRWITILVVPEQEIGAIVAQSGFNKAFVVVIGILIGAIFLIAFIMILQIIHNYRLQRAKDQFVSLASHQLRTPATGVKQFLAVVIRGYVGKVPPKQKDALQKAYDANERQLATIEDLLNVSRFNAGRIKLHKEPVDLKLMIDEIIAGMQDQFKRSDQTVSFSSVTSSRVPADSIYLRMAIENLISNAHKYTLKQGTIKIRTEKIGQEVLIHVKDSGVGISSRDQKRIFKEFSRVDNPLSAAAGGTGLGLYLVKRIVSAHGGSIKVVSKEGSGSEFIIHLPSV